MSSGFRVLTVLENQDGELGIGDVGPLFWGKGEGVSIDRKIAVLFLGKKMMPAISMRMLHETSSTSHDLKSSWCFG